MKFLTGFISNIYRQRHMIIYMAKREFIMRYAGTMGGFLWAVLHPVATVLIFWFVFAVGFKLQGQGDTPFILYFICGYVPWLTFNEVLLISTNGIRNNLHIIKKTVFPSEILPFVYIGAASISHLVFLSMVMIIILLNGIELSRYFLQIVLLYFLLCYLLTGLSWILSALNVIHRDVGQAITIILNLWFWMTPVVWTKNMMPEKYQWLLEINPVTFIVSGYRKSLIYNESIITDYNQILVNLLIATFLFITGAIVFRRLKYEFADAI